jgi:hypothetical protein
MLRRSVTAERREKRLIDETGEARFVGPRDKMVKFREIADSLGLRETSEAVTIAEAFPGYGGNPLGMALRHGDWLHRCLSPLGSGSVGIWGTEPGRIDPAATRGNER